jgi:hypothetical protein
MRNWVGWSAAALIAAGCGGGTGNVAVERAKDDGKTALAQDVVCAKCIVAGDGQSDSGSDWQVSAMPVLGPAAGPGFGGHGIAATGFLRIQHPDGTCLDWAIDTILSCSRVNGHADAVVWGTSPAGFRFFMNASAGSNTLAVAPDQATLPPGHTGGAFQLNGVSPGTGHLDVDKLDRCEPLCLAGECLCPQSGQCEPCDAPPHEDPVVTDPPPVVTDPPPVVTEPPIVTEPPPVIITPPPPPPTGPFIPL